MWIEDLPMQAYTAVEEALVAEQLGLVCYDGTDIPKYDVATGSTFYKKTNGIHDTLWYKSDFQIR